MSGETISEMSRFELNAKYKDFRMAELRELPDDVLRALSLLKQANGNANAIALKAQKVIYERGGCGFGRSHNPNNSHRSPRGHCAGHN